MQFQFDIGSTTKPVAIQPPLPPAEMVPHLLQQILELQRDQFTQMLELQRAHLQHVRAASGEQVARWRPTLGRWQDDHPDLTDNCKKAYLLLEKAYMQMLVTLVGELAEQGDDALDSDFAVQEFLDRYGMKIGQLGHILGVVGLMSEAAQQNDAAKAQQQQQPPPA